jgi:serine/threonine protein phosphatase PrpC
MTCTWSDTAARLSSWFQRKTLPSAVRRIAVFPAALTSDVGLRRDENQDRVAIALGRCACGQPYVLVVLSDGMGGMRDGAVSAATTLGSLFACFFDTAKTFQGLEEALRLAVHAANSTIYSRLNGKGGATLSAVLLCRDVTYIVNVGDSRIYKYADSELSQLTVDDTIAGQLGHSVEADMASNLLQFIGVGESLEVNVMQVPYNSDDLLLLTSDGIHYLDKALIATLIGNAPDPGTALRRLTETSKWCGGHDNASAAIVLPTAALLQLKETREDMFTIWDPYGELYLLPNGLQHAQSGAPEPQSQVSQLGLVTQSPSPAQQADKSTKVKRKRGKKDKTLPQRRNEEVPPRDLDKPKAPQLKIEFPQKDN